MSSLRPTKLAIGLLALVTSTAVAADPECVIATVDDVAVRVADADALRALVHPPPSRDASRRLAVDAALAHLAVRGWLAPSSASGRLEAWTLWLAAVERDAGANAVGATAEPQIARLARRVGVVAGPCATARYASTTPLPEDGGVSTDGAIETALAKANRDAPVVHAVELFVPQGAGSLDELSEAVDDLDSLARRLRATGLPVRVVDLGRIAPHQVVSAFADVAFGLTPGSIGPPVETVFGVHVIHVIERWEPGKLPR